MRKFTLAALAVALVSLCVVQSAHAQPRAAAPSFGSDFRSGFARQLGREVAARAVGGFYGAPGFGSRLPFFLPGRGGFYGSALPAGFFPAPYRGFYGSRQLEIQRALQRQRLRSFGGFYGAQSYHLPPAAFYAPPVLVESPPLLLQQDLGYAASACGTVGLAGVGYGALAAPAYGGCGVGAAQVRGFVPLRGYYR